MLRLIQLIFPCKQVIVPALVVVSLLVQPSNVFMEFLANAGAACRSRLDKPLRMTTGWSLHKFQASYQQIIHRLSTGWGWEGRRNRLKSGKLG